MIDRGRQAAEDLPAATVYVGLSGGVLPAQLLGQRRTGAAGAVLVGSCVPPQELGTDWPAGVPVEVHAMADDPAAASRLTERVLAFLAAL